MSQTCFVCDGEGSISNVNNIINAPEHGAEEEISNEFYADTKISNGSSKNVSKTSLEKRYSSKISLLRKKSYTVSSCRICLSHLVNPGVLSCGHRFCEECLYNYWKNGEAADCIVCPLCRTCTENFDFVQKDDQSPPAFRNSLGALASARKSNFTSICLKTSLFLPALYCITKCLKWFFFDFLFKTET